MFFRENTSTESLLRGELPGMELDEPNGCTDGCMPLDFNTPPSTSAQDEGK